MTNNAHTNHGRNPLLTKAREAIEVASRRAGVTLRRRSVYNDPAIARDLLLRALNIDLVLDVGANEGQYATGLFDAGYTGRLHSVEPLPDAHSILSAACAPNSLWSTTPEPLAIAESTGTFTFHQSENSVSSSLLKVHEQHVSEDPASQTARSFEVEAQSLDDFWDSLPGPAGQRIHLKLDVQGAEHTILDAAQRWRTEIQSAQLELSLASLYEGQASAVSLLNWLDELGFALVGIEQGFTSFETGQVLQFDGIFARRPLPAGFAV